MIETSSDSVHASAAGTSPPGGPPRLGVVLTPRAFWGVFVGAWAAYGVLMTSAFVFAGDSLGAAALGALANEAPLIVPAALLAFHRRRFLDPLPTLGRFIAHKLLVGIGYALTVCAVGGIVIWLSGKEPVTEFGSEPWAVFAGLFMLGLFFYVVFLGFLMGADALERVQESRALAAREAVLRAQAEAKALRAQFNPHFVFNTLHSLMLLVRKDPDTAERAIEDVAALIRYASTLQRREVDQVPLSKELAFAKRYISLEKLRLADRLTVVWDIEPSLDDVFVPAFSLQTLLENSIKHGISDKPEGGCVSIRASANGETVSLVVEDDGLGAHQAAVSDNGGSGLQLLRQRLSAVHGGDASLTWQTSKSEGFRVTVRLPILRAPTEPTPPA